MKESDIDRKIKGHPRKILDSLGYKIKLPQELFFEIPSYVNELSEIILGIAKFHKGSLIEAKQQFEEQILAANFPAQSETIFKFALYNKNQDSNRKTTEYQSVILFYYYHLG